MYGNYKKGGKSWKKNYSKYGKKYKGSKKHGTKTVITKYKW